MKQAPLANAELAIMNLLWENERLTTRFIREQLYPDSEKAQHGTVQKLLNRLEEKGYVERDRSLPVHFYSAKISRHSYSSSQLVSLADKLTAGSIAPLITHLIEEKQITRDELDRIRDLIDKANDEGEQS